MFRGCTGETRETRSSPMMRKRSLLFCPSRSRRSWSADRIGAGCTRTCVDPDPAPGQGLSHAGRSTAARSRHPVGHAPARRQAVRPEHGRHAAHALLTSGPSLHISNARMGKMGASLSVTLVNAGTYRFTTKAGEDYMAGVKTSAGQRPQADRRRHLDSPTCPNGPHAGPFPVIVRFPAGRLRGSTDAAVAAERCFTYADDVRRGLEGRSEAARAWGLELLPRFDAARRHGGLGAGVARDRLRQPLGDPHRTIGRRSGSTATRRSCSQPRIGDTLSIASVAQAGVVAEIAERLAALQLGIEGRRRLTIILPLVEGAHDGGAGAARRRPALRPGGARARPPPGLPHRFGSRVRLRVRARSDARSSRCSRSPSSGRARPHGTSIWPARRASPKKCSPGPGRRSSRQLAAPAGLSQRR